MQYLLPPRYFLPVQYIEIEEAHEMEDTEWEEEEHDKPATLFALRREIFMRNKF